MGPLLQVWIKKYKYVLLVLLLLPCLYAYNPFPLYFLNDDFIHVPLSQQAVWGQRNSIRPVSDISIFIDSKIWGNNAFGYHLTNVIFHLLNVVVILILSRKFFRLFEQENVELISAAVAILFAGYAFHSEGVLWVIGRGSVIASFLFIYCLTLFLHRRRKWFHYLLCYLAFFVGLLTYESIAVLIPTLLITVVFYHTYRRKKDLAFVAGLLPVFLYYLYVRIKWTGSLTSSYEVAGNTGLKSLASNFLKLITRSFTGPQASVTLFIVTAAIFIVAFTLLFAFATERLKMRNFGYLSILFILSLTPYLTLGIDTHGVESERYLYLPSIFFCILLVYMLSSLRSKALALSVFILYFLYHQYFLLKSARAFVVASDVATKTIQTVKSNKTADHYYFKNLVQENYGVPIFRLGLQEGIAWQTGEVSNVKKVTILSKNSDEQNVFSQKLKLIFCSKERAYNLGKSLLIEYTDTSINVCNTP